MTGRAVQDPMQLDLGDVGHRVGQLVGGGPLCDPCSSGGLRRRVMAMDDPNPIHRDQAFVRQSEFGGPIAPQSMAVALDFGHGCPPASIGRIPGSRLIFGGEEWGHYGYRVRPGDPLFQERRLLDRKVAETQQVRLKNQDGGTLVDAVVHVELPAGQETS